MAESVNPQLMRADQLVRGWGRKAREQARRRVAQARREGDSEAELRWLEVEALVGQLLLGGGPAF